MLRDVYFDTGPNDSGVGIEERPCSVHGTDWGWGDMLVRESIPSVADTVRHTSLSDSTVVAVDSHLFPDQVPFLDSQPRYGWTATIHAEDDLPVARDREDPVEYLPISVAF